MTDKKIEEVKRHMENVILMSCVSGQFDAKDCVDRLVLWHLSELVLAREEDYKKGKEDGVKEEQERTLKTIDDEFEVLDNKVNDPKFEKSFVYGEKFSLDRLKSKIVKGG